MTNEVDKLSGVGAFIVTPARQFLTIKELHSSKRTVKEAGMRSHPMESTEPGETPLQTLDRIFQEEIVLPDGHGIKFMGPLCEVQITFGIWVRMFLFEAGNEFVAKPGPSVNEVSDPGWLSIDEVLSSSVGNERFRPGVRETILGYLSYLSEYDHFGPSILRYDHAIDEPQVMARLKNRA